MTSETFEKEPLIISPFGNGGPRAHRNTLGVFIIISTWIYLYFACAGPLFDGIREFMWSSDYHVHVLSNVATEIAVTIASSVLAGANAPVEFGSTRYYMVRMGRVGVEQSDLLFIGPKRATYVKVHHQLH